MSPNSPAIRQSLVSLTVGFACFLSAHFFPTIPLFAPSQNPTQPASSPILTLSTPALSTAPESPPASTPEARFAGAAREPDLFRSAAQSLAAIEQLTAADFAAYSARHEPPDDLLDVDNSLTRLVAEAFVERWLTVDPAGAVPALIALTAKNEHGEELAHGRNLSSALARRHPAEFLAAIRHDPDYDENYPDAAHDAYAAFAAFAATNPAAARALLAELPANKRPGAEVSVMTGIAQVDPLAAILWCKEIRQTDRTPTKVIEAAIFSAERAGQGTLHQVLEAGGENLLDRDTAKLLQLRYPDLEIPYDWNAPFSGSSSFQPEREITALSLDEVKARLAKLTDYETLSSAPEALLKAWAFDEPRAALVEAWALDEPRAALEWARTHLNPHDSYAPDCAFAVWLNQDEPAALAWLEAQPASLTKTSLARVVASRLAELGRIEDALAIQSAPGLSSYIDSSFFGRLAEQASRKNPALAAAWVARLPSELETEMAIEITTQQFFTRDPTAAAQWIQSLPPGKTRDLAATRAAGLTAPHDLDTAADWVNVIADPKHRADAVRLVFWNASQASPAAARMWLRAWPEVTTAERERLIRHLK